MIRYLLVILAGVTIGYIYGYRQGEAGDESLLAVVGINKAVDGPREAARRVRQEEKARQATIDSIRRARADSLSSRIHP